MTFQIILGIKGGITTLGTLQGHGIGTLLMPYKTVSCDFGTTIFTRSVYHRINEGVFIICLTERSEIKVTIIATRLQLCKQNNSENYVASVTQHLLPYMENSIEGKSNHKEKD